VKDIGQSPSQHLEWMSWRSFCKHFDEVTGMDINHDRCNPMVDAIKRWGEELVELRKEHPIALDVLNRMREDAPINPNVYKGTEK